VAKPRLFLCYAREDSAFCDALVAGLRVRDVDVLWDRALQPPMDYAEQIRNMIRVADSCAIVLTPASAASSECLREIQYAIATGKRLIPILRDPALESSYLPDALRTLQWCLCTEATPLASGVAQICDALRTNIDLVPMHTQLLNRIEDWEARGRHRGNLLGDPALAEAEGWLVRASDSAGLPQPTPVQREYLNLSRREASRRSRRFRVGAVSTIAVLGVALALAVWFKQQADREAANARVQEGFATKSAELATERNRRLLEEQGRQDLVSGQWETAAVRLVEAFRLGADTPALRLMLAAAMTPLNGVTMIIPGGDSTVLSTDVSADGRHVAVAGADGRVRIWNVESGLVEGTLGPHEGRIDEVYLNGDGSRALVSFRTRDLEYAETTSRIYRPAARLWNVTQEKSIQDDWRFAVSYSDAQEPRSIVIAADDRTFTFAEYKDEPFSFDDGRSLTGRPKEVRPAPAAGRVPAPALTAESNTVFLSSPGARRTALLATAPMKNASIAFRQASSDLIIVSADGAYRRLPDGPQVPDQRLPAEIAAADKLLALSRDGRWAVGQRGGLSVLLDLDRLPKGLSEATIDEMNPVTDARFSWNSEYLITRSGSQNRSELMAFRLRDLPAPSGPTGGSSVQYQRYGLFAVSSTGQDFLAGGALETRFWKAGQQASSYDVRADAGLSAAEYSPNGKYMALGLDDGTVVIRQAPPPVKSDTTIDAHDRRARSHASKVTDLAFDAASVRVASASEDGTAKLWDLAAGTLISTCQGHRGAINTVEFSPDGSLLATGGMDGTARVWDVPACRELLRFPVGSSPGSSPVRKAIFDGRGARLAAADADAVRVWDLPRETRAVSELVSRLQQVGPVCSSGDRLVRWSVPATGAPRRCDVK